MSRSRGCIGPECGAGEGSTCDKPACRPTYKTCRPWGDPHVITFDGTQLDVYGVATYILSQTTSAGVANGGTQVTLLTFISECSLKLLFFIICLKTYLSGFFVTLFYE